MTISGATAPPDVWILEVANGASWRPGSDARAGRPGAQAAVVVDPQRDVAQYLAFAQENDLRITHVFLTHLHADFLAGHLELRDRTGATICLGANAKAEYAFGRWVTATP